MGIKQNRWGEVTEGGGEKNEKLEWDKQRVKSYTWVDGGGGGALRGETRLWNWIRRENGGEGAALRTGEGLIKCERGLIGSTLTEGEARKPKKLPHWWEGMETSWAREGGA